MLRADSWSSWDWEPRKIEEKENIYNFEFENAPIETPNTGDESHIKLLAGIMILSILGIVLLAIKLYKKNKEKKKNRIRKIKTK